MFFVLLQSSESSSLLTLLENGFLFCTRSKIIDLQMLGGARGLLGQSPCTYLIIPCIYVCWFQTNLLLSVAHDEAHDVAHDEAHNDLNDEVYGDVYDSNFRRSISCVW